MLECYARRSSGQYRTQFSSIRLQRRSSRVKCEMKLKDTILTRVAIPSSFAHDSRWEAPVEDTRFDDVVKKLGILTSRRLSLGAMLAGVLGLRGLAEVNVRKGAGKNPFQVDGRRGKTYGLAANAKKKSCPPCKKRKKGKCKAKLPDRTPCPGGSCLSGNCVAAAPPECVTAATCPTPSASQECQQATCDNGKCGFGPKPAGTVCHGGPGSCIAGSCVCLNAVNGICCTTQGDCPAPSASQPCAQAAICLNGGCQFSLKGPATVCRQAAGECDLAEHCDSGTPSCPPDLVKPANTACTADGIQCTDDICNGTSVTCQHPQRPNGSPCGGNNTCTSGVCG